MALKTFLRDKKSGRVYFNRARRYVQPFVLGPDSQAATAELDAGGTAMLANGIYIPKGSQSGPVPSSVGQEGPFEGFSLAYRATTGATAGSRGNAGLLVKITDDGAKRSFMNDWVHADTIFGNGPFPFILPETIMLEERRALIWQFKNLNNDTDKNVWVYPAVLGRRFYRQSAPAGSLDGYIGATLKRQQLSIPYFYVPDNLLSGGTIIGTGGAVTTVLNDGSISLTAGQRYKSVFFTIDSSGHFDWYKTMLLASQPHLLDFEIRDPETKRVLMNTFTFASLGGSIGFLTGKVGTNAALEVPGSPTIISDGAVATYYGSAGITPACAPAIWPEPLFCARKQQIEIILNNYHNAVQNVYITLGGRRIFATEGEM